MLITLSAGTGGGSTKVSISVPEMHRVMADVAGEATAQALQTAGQALQTAGVNNVGAVSTPVDPAISADAGGGESNNDDGVASAADVGGGKAVEASVGGTEAPDTNVGAEKGLVLMLNRGPVI